MRLRRHGDGPRMTGWRQIQGLSSERDLWVVPQGPTRPELGPWVATDGRRVWDLVATGRASELPFPVWMEQPDAGGDRRGDMLWTQGVPITVVSDDFVKSLKILGVPGWQTFHLDVSDLSGQDVPGYCGLIPDATGTSNLVSGWWPSSAPTYVLLATDDLCLSLKHMGLLFDHEPVTDRRRVEGLTARL